MELLNEKFKNYKTPNGINYFHDNAISAVLTYFNEYVNLWKIPTNKEEFVALLYSRYNEAKVDNEKCKAKGMTGLILNDEFVEDILITTVYIDKKMSWEDIQYTKEHGGLPEKLIKAGFPFDEVKKEMFKQGYVVPAKEKNKEETL